nr:unnamed protein product [Callosobruchus chinensis]
MRFLATGALTRVYNICLKFLKS